MQSRRYHIVIASVVFSCLMWVSINLGNEYQVTSQVPIIIDKIPEGKALKFPIPKRLTVKLKGTGWRLAWQTLLGEPKSVLNLSALGTTSITLAERDLRESIDVPHGIAIVDVSPDALVIEFEAYQEKWVRVVPQVDLEFREGFGLIGAIAVNPESVLIGGSVSAVKDLQTWSTTRKSYHDIRESFTAELPLAPPLEHSLRVVHDKVQVSVNVQPFAEKVFAGLPVEVLSMPPNREVIFIPPRVDITARGGIDRLASLTNSDFRLSVNFQMLVDDTTGIVQPRIDSPAGIRVVVRRPERLQYIIRKRL